MTKVHSAKLKVKLWEFPINTGDKILNNRFAKTPMMTDSTENADNEYVLTAIVAIRENNARPDIKAMKDYINKNFATNEEKEL